MKVGWEMIFDVITFVWCSRRFLLLV
jgi:hypothetical protein